MGLHKRKIMYNYVTGIVKLFVLVSSEVINQEDVKSSGNLVIRY